MPTMEQVLERMERISPSTYDDETRAGWLLDLEGQLREEFYPRYLDAQELEAQWPLRFPEDKELPLSVKEPWDEVYDLYIGLMLSYHRREFANYNNQLAMFQSKLDDYRKHYHRTHTPISACGFRNTV